MKKRMKLFGLVLMCTMVSEMALAQAAMPKAPAIIDSQAEVYKEITYIDNMGTKGTLTSFKGGEDIFKFTFLAQTEIGESMESFYVQQDRITEVIEDKTEYNRPKFWNEQVAKSNGDDQWFDPEKSTHSRVVYTFKDGRLASWKESEGETMFAITKAASKKEKELKKRYAEFVKALKKMIRLGSLLVILLFFIGCSDDDDTINGFTVLQENTIIYFKEVALGFENIPVTEVTRKWRDPMKIFVGGESVSGLREELDEIVADINALTTDGFELEIVQDTLDANYYVYFGSAQGYSAIYPEFSNEILADPGLFNVLFNQRAELFGGHLYVDINRVDITEQRHLLREGITQSIGFARDSDRVQNSIFQRAQTSVTEFADIDRELIRLLYHPDMVVGLDELGTEVVLREIFKKENAD